jgi:hypothetical protein
MPVHRMKNFKRHFFISKKNQAGFHLPKESGKER